MSVTYGNANYRKKFDAFHIIDQSGHEPLKKAIECALRLREATVLALKAMEGDIKPETRAQLTLALARCLPDEFQAWIKVAEFVYAKPKHMTVDGSVTLESLLAGTWDQPALPEGNHNGEGNNSH